MQQAEHGQFEHSRAPAAGAALRRPEASCAMVAHPAGTFLCPACRMPAAVPSRHDVSSRCIARLYRFDTSRRICWSSARNASPGIAARFRGSASAGIRRTLSGMGSMRSVVDYALARRATLESVLLGQTTIADVCDAHPYLLRAAKFHGEPTDRPCPICRRARLTHVTYVYGDELGQYEGRVKQGPRTR